MIFINKASAYPHWAKNTAQTSKKKPCRNCHPKVCTKAEKSIENNPEIIIAEAEGIKKENFIRNMRNFINELYNIGRF